MSQNLLFEYNLRDEVTAEIKVGQNGLADTRRSYQYDNNGNLTQLITPNGEITVYSYDVANRQVEAHHYASTEQQKNSQPEKTVNYRYTNTNQFAGYSDGITETDYTYDALNRLTQVVTTFNKGKTNEFQKTYGYSYYKNGQKKTYTTPEGQTYTYYYNGNNQLSGVAIPGQGRISYNNFSWLIPQNISYPGNSQVSLIPDGLMRYRKKLTTDPASNPMHSLAWEYDNESNITQITQTEETADYGYDKLYRLTEAQYSTNDNVENHTPRTNEAYQYDKVGNRLDEKANKAELAPAQGSKEWTYNAFNQLTEQNGISYDYSKNGHLIRSGKRNTEGQIAVDPDNVIPFWAFIYNSEERLTEVKKNNLTVATYQYNPLGQRVSKTLADNNTIIHYLYSQEGLVGEYDEQGNLIQEYGWKPNTLWMTGPLFTRTQDNQVHYYVNDHLGTPQKAFRRNGKVTWKAEASAFGETVVWEGSELRNNLRFAGQYYDSETGLHYNFFRDYDPVKGRYVEGDPISLLGGVNRYLYVSGRPLSMVDPDGKIPLLAFIVVPVVGGLAQGIASAITGQSFVNGFISGATTGLIATAFAFSGGFVAITAGIVTEVAMSTNTALGVDPNYAQNIGNAAKAFNNMSENNSQEKQICE